ncbi:MAG: hypothetical protein QW101_04420 [Ignisphaera sp.]|uniref:Uncharacterized protein n=1 Tax=Ignisphaera aggregans TaxID=334771 RepID=A0A7J3MZK2_9CREN
MLIEVNKQIRDVYVVVCDPKKFIKALEILDKYGIKVRGVDAHTRSVHGVIVADTEGRQYLASNSIDVYGYIIDIDEWGLEKGLATTVVFAKTSVVRPLMNTIVGIDYGKSIGIAIIVNSDIVYINSYRSKENVLKDIRFFIENVDTRVKIIRIGIASNLEDTFIDTLINTFRGMASIELVPEHRSSKLRYFIDRQRLKSDEVAAINIALYRGNS